MHVPKPTEADERYFRSIVPADPRIEVKPMFGNLGALVNGNMFMGLFGSQVGLKLTPSEIAALMSIDGAGPFGPSERPMAGYVSLPPAWRGDPQAAQWVSRALDVVAPMPPKKPKRG